MKTFFFLLFITSYTLLNAQSQFQRAIGGTGGDYAYTIIRTTDGGYALAGYTNSFGAGGIDFYIVKLDGSGTLQWSRTVGGTGLDYGYSIIQTTDGGYTVCGQTSSFGAGLTDMYIVKLDAGGVIQWTRAVGRTNDDIAYSIIQTTDGGFAVAGYSGNFGAGLADMYIIKLDGSGTLQWSRTAGGTQNDVSYSIIQTTDGGFAAAGYTISFGAGNYDIYIVKFTGNGTLQWSRTVGGVANNEYGYSIIQTTDGGYAVCGETTSFGAGNKDMYIAKLTASAVLQWTKTAGGTNNDIAYSIIQTSDGGYAMAGYTNSFGAGGYDMYIVKLDAGGTFQSNRTVGRASGNDYAYFITQTTDGGYAMAGNTQSFGAGGNDMYIIKLDAGWNTCGNTISPLPNIGTGGPLGAPVSTVTSPISIVTLPTSSSGTGGTVTTICVIGIRPISNEIPVSYVLEQNYPNPFNPKTIINFHLPMFNYVSLKVYDVLGKEIAVLVSEQLKPGTYEVDWDGNNFVSGVYYYKLFAGEYTETKKMILIK